MKNQESLTANNIRILNNSLAISFGSNAATFINRLDYWLQQGYGELHNNKRWIFNTYQQWSDQLPWLSVDQIKRIIRKLKDDGILLIERLKRHQWRQVNYYTLNYDRIAEILSEPNAESIRRNRRIDQAKSPDHRSVKTDQKKLTEREKKKIDENEDNQREKSINQAETCSQQELKVNAEPTISSKGQNISAFHKALLSAIENEPSIRNPLAYAQKVVDNLKAGSASSERIYQQWLDIGEIKLPRQSTQTSPPSSPTVKPSSSENHPELPTGFKTWLIKQLQLPNESAISARYRADKVVSSSNLDDYLAEYNRINSEAKHRYADEEDRQEKPNQKQIDQARQVLAEKDSQSESEQFLPPIENARNALNLLKNPNPISQRIGKHLLATAKAQASQAEIEEIEKLEKFP